MNLNKFNLIADFLLIVFSGWMSSQNHSTQVTLGVILAIGWAMGFHTGFRWKR